MLDCLWGSGGGVTKDIRGNPRRLRLMQVEAALLWAPNWEDARW